MSFWHKVVPLIAAALLLAALWLPSGPILTVACMAMLAAAVVSAVHHAEVVAHRVGEPYGTLVLALAVTAIEVALIVSLMLAGGVEDDHFSETFGCAINAGGANRLISGDEHKTLDAVRQRGLNDIVRSKYIVRDGFDNICLHQRNMLVRRGVKDNLWLVLLKNLSKAFGIADISDDR